MGMAVTSQLLIIDSYAWRLEAAVWVKVPHESDEVRCRPRLLLVNRSWGHEELEQYGVVGFIEYDESGHMEGRASWLVYHYPRDAEGIWEHHDETRYGFRHVLSAGETRYPRPSAKEALRHLLELTKLDIPKPEHGALATTAEAFLPVLQKVTDTYVRRQRQTAKA
jgi:hypothetical protein